MSDGRCPYCFSPMGTAGCTDSQCRGSRTGTPTVVPMDRDSKMDLDDVAAGHPVAMRELAELRGRVERAERAYSRLDIFAAWVASTQGAFTCNDLIGTAERARSEASAALLELMPWKKATHRCKVCGTLWAYFPAGFVTHEVEGEGPEEIKSEAFWSLASDSARMGKCCDNAPMGGQIEAIPDSTIIREGDAQQGEREDSISLDSTIPDKGDGV